MFGRIDRNIDYIKRDCAEIVRHTVVLLDVVKLLIMTTRPLASLTTFATAASKPTPSSPLVAIRP
jgi:hypothetical protein